MKSKSFLLIFILLISFSNTNAQITIGSDLTPNKGAILDLKQHEPTTDNVTASKGMGIPRVNLTTPNALSDITGATGLEAEHIGLVVYNTNKCLNKTGRDNGIYVWTGIEWQTLNNNIIRSPDVYELSDTRAGITEKYTYGMFGNAGIWMTENMRATHYSDGTPINLHDGSSQHATPAYAYPSSTLTGWNTPVTSYDENPKQGVLYNWAAATRKYSGKYGADQGQNSTILPSGNEVEVDSSLPDKDYRNYYVVQGICPDGWHVPSDREWNELEKEIYENADKYSTYTNAEVNATTGWNSTDPWLATWETSVLGRGSSTSMGHGLAMQNPCYLMNTNNALGTSKLSIEGGFNLLLAGFADESAAGEYGGATIMWCSSSGGSTVGYMHMWRGTDVKVTRSRAYSRGFYSVRCKKNDLNP